MQKVFFLIIGILFLYSCKPDEVSRTGYLDVDVRYTGGASQMELDGVKIALHRTDGGNLEEKSKWINKTGIQRIELPAGNYKLVLTGNRCKSDSLAPHNNIVIIKQGESTEKAIGIEKLPYSMIIKYKGRELSQDETINITNGESLDIWNKYSTNILKWNIHASESWITFNEKDGTIEKDGINSVIFNIGNLPHNVNYANVVLTTTTDNGSFSIKVKAEKNNNLNVTTFNVDVGTYGSYAMRGRVFFNNTAYRPTEVGFYYGKSNNPRETGTQIVLDADLGYANYNGEYFDFRKTLWDDDLEKGATYYVQAYAKNFYETAFGNVISFLCAP